MIRRAALALAALVALPASAQGPGATPLPPPGSTSMPPLASPGMPSNPGPKASKTSQPDKPLPRGSVLEEVNGTVLEVDREKHRIVIDTGAGAITLRMDRNSLVYGARGLTTVLDVTPGAQVRAGRNADFLAYWVQLRAPRAPATSTPGQGTGPGGGSGAPAEGTTQGAPSPGPTTVGPGSTAPGPGGSPPGAGP
jgi:hypothetical protein